MLLNVVCEELLIEGSGYPYWTPDTNQLANMLVNVNVAQVVLVDCRYVNIEELRNLYPAITFSVGDTHHKVRHSMLVQLF